MDKTYKLLTQIEEAARKIYHTAYNMNGEYDTAVREYDCLSIEDYYLTGPEDDGQYLAEDIDNGIETASRYLNEVMGNLAEVDRQLMKLIRIRGQLAEEIGIPIGGKEWVRLETYEM